ncbi:hypothetical protein GUITHDRAFT_111327 [Guillardia theta CCMP2712]|uniref:Uncharacterized protein n=1 Tax=Guillardia theta (strain CCMP2712) TaxID=905079 RepID=L1J296_GUITC|nr:hypothetical protein GUITHDRAFT_111327 [Guillardia theta CCMP2712]EKX42648.1 hypothetical protein GUITHDRAFT_111327 [Guillardia theta CCMP2712]|eukprot:XP_005829628.1 hypothetical protein GUITHDRAFT_111327 [Guillardia theta CCMP2712]
MVQDSIHASPAAPSAPPTHQTPQPNDIRLRRTIKPSPDWTLSQHAAPSRRASFPQLDSLPSEQSKKRRQSAGTGELLWNSVMKARAKATGMTEDETSRPATQTGACQLELKETTMMCLEEGVLDREQAGTR